MMITCIDYYGREIKSKVRPILKDGHIVHRITVPKGYLKPDPVVTLPGVEVDEIVWCWIDPKTAKGPRLKRACEMNVVCARVATWKLESYFSPYLGTMKAAQDRCYFDGVDGELLARDIRRTGTFKEADGSLHDPHEPGWEYVGSWKTTRRPTPVLQVTLWRAWVGQRPTMHIEGKPPPPITGHADYVAELDLDLEAGIKHVAEALRNEISGAKTHPYIVNQMIARYWGIVSFRLEPGA